MTKVIGRHQWFAILPLTTISVIYWVRDRLRFNRGNAMVTSTQKLALVLNLLWMVFTWCVSVHIRHGDVVSALLTAPLVFTLGHMSTLLILNDTIYLTRQQMYSFGLGLIMEYMWTVYNIFMYSEE